MPGSGEFMIAWLGVMRKLIDVKAITDSTHSLPAPNIPPANKHLQFEPIYFLAKAHKVQIFGTLPFSLSFSLRRGIRFRIFPKEVFCPNLYNLH